MNNDNQSRSDKHLEIRKKILQMISSRGPLLPIHISQETGLNTLISSAFLSELLSQKLLKISNLRIGSSPLYYAPGQENMLIKFEDYIKGREKEAYNLLKQKGVLRDDKQEPAIRVALRSIKDFAFPMTIKIGNEQMNFWRFLLLKEQDAREVIKKKMQGEERIITKKPAQEMIMEKPAIPKIVQQKPAQQILINQPIEKKEEEKPKTKTKKEKTNILLENVKEYLKSWDIELLEELEIMKKEVLIRVRINSDLDKIEFLAICKDKKRISENDLMMALQKAKSKKMPCLLITPGDLNKKAEAYFEQWKNMIKVRRIKFK